MSKKQMSECSYAEHVASYLEGFGSLQGASEVAERAEYVAKAEAWGMTALRCASNIADRKVGR